MVPTTLRFESIYLYIGIQEMIENLRSRIGKKIAHVGARTSAISGPPHTIAAGSSGVLNGSWWYYWCHFD